MPQSSHTNRYNVRPSRGEGQMSQHEQSGTRFGCFPLIHALTASVYAEKAPIHYNPDNGRSNGQKLPMVTQLVSFERFRTAEEELKITVLMAYFSGSFLKGTPSSPVTNSEGIDVNEKLVAQFCARSDVGKKSHLPRTKCRRKRSLRIASRLEGSESAPSSTLMIKCNP